MILLWRVKTSWRMSDPLDLMIAVRFSSFRPYSHCDEVSALSVELSVVPVFHQKQLENIHRVTYRPSDLADVCRSDGSPAKLPQVSLASSSS